MNRRLVAALAVLIAALAPVSGAHFNPVVSGVMAARGALTRRDAAAYAVVQVAGCCAGAILVHAMFELPLLQSASQARVGAAYWFTSSTSFANPAITIARALSDTFTGIRPLDVPAFVLAQSLGGLAGLGLSRYLFAAGRRLP